MHRVVEIEKNSVFGRMFFCLTGERVPLLVQRTAPAIGNVTVDWRIEGPQALLTFVETSGVLFFTEVRRI